MTIARLRGLFTIVLTFSLLVSTGSARDLAPRQYESPHSEPEAELSELASALVEQVRRATITFRDIRQAAPGGYGPFLGCVSGPQAGAMGVHYVNSTYLEDGEIVVSRPEALIYETRRGVARLVGVEYIVKAAQWDRRNPQPPVLEGQVFHYNGSPNRYGIEPFYELHVWAWRDNPHGAFVDWNPRVTCEG